MAPAAKNSTPGRRKRTDNQYFEPGKRGRKTGLELKDLGERDEHGLEPISGIFSSPHEQDGDKTLTSEDMDMQISGCTQSAWDDEMMGWNTDRRDCRLCARCTSDTLSAKDAAFTTTTTIHTEAYKHWIP